MYGISRCGSGQCGVVTLPNGVRLYVSYSTVIGVDAPNGTATFTDKKYSVTTSKQRNTKLMRAAGHSRSALVSHDFFVGVVRGMNLDLTIDNNDNVRSPHSF